ncbi:hypothetical protein [Viscerimonas tarda]
MSERLRSVQNAEDLNRLAAEVNCQYIGFLGAPDKEFSKESIIADVNKFLKNVKTGSGFQTGWFTDLD